MPYYLAVELRRDQLDEFRSDPVARVACPVVFHCNNYVCSFHGRRNLNSEADVGVRGM
ncbi:hypothetical protein REMIM1_CH01594 [Rhizobium etli bv. mimosae str. Mim1]|nr:hypothetical protein REMIM1_CH01594 [Rhizobium etli bv. mimosae str. Mim1]